jgi:hypothetical protein
MSCRINACSNSVTTPYISEYAARHKPFVAVAEVVVLRREQILALQQLIAH